MLSSLRSPLPLDSLGFVQQRGPGTPRRRRLLWDRVLNNVLTEPYDSWHRTMDLLGGVFAVFPAQALDGNAARAALAMRKGGCERQNE